MQNLIICILLLPSLVLTGWALWVYFTRPDPDAEDFLARRDEWGAR